MRSAKKKSGKKGQVANRSDGGGRNRPCMRLWCTGLGMEKKLKGSGA